MLLENHKEKPLAVKTDVKTFVSRHIHDLGMNRVGLSALVKKSLSYMSQVEGGTTNFPAELVSDYGVALRLNADEMRKFSELVKIQNSRRGVKSASPKVREISAILATKGEVIPEATLTEIERLISEALRQAKVSYYRKGSRSGSGGASPNRMTPERFMEIHRTLSAFRQKSVGAKRGFFCVTEMIEYADAYHSDFQVVWCQYMPPRFGHAYACLETIGGVSTLYVSEQLYREGHSNTVFARHVLSHEVSHYALGHNGLRYLAPAIYGDQKTHKITDADPAEELEANIGAALLLVFWPSLFRARQTSRDSVIASYKLDVDSAKTLHFMMDNPTVKHQLQQLV